MTPFNPSRRQFSPLGLVRVLSSAISGSCVVSAFFYLKMEMMPIIREIGISQIRQNIEFAQMNLAVSLTMPSTSRLPCTCSFVVPTGKIILLIYEKTVNKIRHAAPAKAKRTSPKIPMNKNAINTGIVMIIVADRSCD